MKKTRSCRCRTGKSDEGKPGSDNSFENFGDDVEFRNFLKIEIC